MRLAVPLFALLCASAAAAEPLPESVPPPTIVRIPYPLVANAADHISCRDRIHQVREERGLQQLERDTASSDEPLLIAAVDHRIDGCSVMVVYGNTSDVRPVPTSPDGPPRLQRIPTR